MKTDMYAVLKNTHISRDYALKKEMRYMNRLLEKLFLGGEWAVGIRKKGERKYKIIEEGKSRYWLADPFLYKYGEKYYLFCEAYIRKTNKGVLRAFEIHDDFSLKDLGTIVEKPYHMSYPHMFNINDDIYMIPETSGNRTVELYKCIEFPLKWGKTCDLISDTYAVDTNVFEYNNEMYLITYSFNDILPKLEVYQMNKNTFKLSLVYEEEYKENNGRGAGNIIVNEGGIMRPTQNQLTKYGESIFWKKCSLDNGYSEEIVSETKISEIEVDTNVKYKRIHTYNSLDMIEVVDVRTETIDLFLPWKKIKRYLYNNVKR